MVTLVTRPEPLEVALDKSAIIVVDMQNAFASNGGLQVSRYMKAGVRYVHRSLRTFRWRLGRV